MAQRVFISLPRQTSSSRAYMSIYILNENTTLIEISITRGLSARIGSIGARRRELVGGGERDGELECDLHDGIIFSLLSLWSKSARDYIDTSHHQHQQRMIWFVSCSKFEPNPACWYARSHDVLSERVHKCVYVNCAGFGSDDRVCPHRRPATTTSLHTDGVGRSVYKSQAGFGSLLACLVLAVPIRNTLSRWKCVYIVIYFSSCYTHALHTHTFMMLALASTLISQQIRILNSPLP